MPSFRVLCHVSIRSHLPSVVQIGTTSCMPAPAIITVTHCLISKSPIAWPALSASCTRHSKIRRIWKVRVRQSSHDTEVSIDPVLGGNFTSTNTYLSHSPRPPLAHSKVLDTPKGRRQRLVIIRPSHGYIGGSCIFMPRSNRWNSTFQIFFFL